MRLRSNDIVRVIQKEKPVGPYYKVCGFEGNHAYCHQIIDGRVDEDHTYVYSKNRLQKISVHQLSISKVDYKNLFLQFPTTIKVPRTPQWERLVIKMNEDSNIVINLHNYDKCIYARLSSAVKTGLFKKQPTITLCDTKLI